MDKHIQFGEQLRVKDQPRTIYEVDETNRHLVIREEKTRRMWSMSFEEFGEGYENKDIIFVNADKNPSATTESTNRLIDSYSETELKCAEIRLGWIMSSVDDMGHWNANTRERHEHQKTYALSIGIKDHTMSDRNIRRLYARWKASGKSLHSLVPKVAKRGNREARLSEDQQSIMDKYIRDYYLDRARPSVARVHGLMDEAIRNQPQYQGVEPISYSSVKRAINKIPEYSKCISRHGWMEAQRRYPHGSAVQKPLYLMQRVELDHTPLDVIATCDETGEILGRPYLTLFLESLSKMVTGFHIEFNQPTSRTVLKALKNVVLPKDRIITENPDLVGYTWPCWGLMSEISTDNGSDLASDFVRYAMSSLDIVIHYNPKGRPNYKGSIERHFRTLNEQTMAFIPSKTFSRHTDLGDNKPKKSATLTLSEITRIVETWVVAIYHHTVHSGIKEKPIDAWNRLSMDLPAIRLPPSIEEIDRLLWKRHERKVQKNGLSINNMTYQSVEVQDIARQHGHGKTVEIFTDDSDITVIRLKVPDTQNYIDVPAEQNDYTKLKLNYEDHSEVVKTAQQMNVDEYGKAPAPSKLSVPQLLAAWHAILKIRDESAAARKRSKREAEAKRRNRSQGKYNGVEKSSPGTLTNDHDESPLPINIEDL